MRRAAEPGCVVHARVEDERLKPVAAGPMVGTREPAAHGGAWLRDLMAHMGHDSERAAMICRPGCAGSGEER